jgi:NAD(P) transhydrogenase subunit beta
MTTAILVDISYLAASVLFILGLRSLAKPEHARRGMNQAALGMLLAIVGTLLKHEIVRYDWIIAGLAVGTAIGYPLGMYVPMTAMPQRIAISHLFGALAATLVGVAEYQLSLHGVGEHSLTSARMAALGFEVLFGALTVSGSFMAFAKLQELVSGRPITYPGQNALNLSLFAAMVGILIWLVIDPTQSVLLYVMTGLSFAFGCLLVLPIGGADMPVVISLMNSYAGLACSATGFALGNQILIIAGALDGASGFILSIVMSKAMNRSFRNVLFGAFGTVQTSTAAKTAEGLTVRSVSLEDAALQLVSARRVIVIPGYGMAVAQAQHDLRELGELIERAGGTVEYAIHPVAGRMPGHMNVLLAEAKVPYDKLKDMDDINDEFSDADVALVIGANDVVNPAARSDQSSPIYGMPILNADHAKSVIVLKRGMNPGFAGIENELFYHQRTAMLFGDAKNSLVALVQHIKTQNVAAAA